MSSQDPATDHQNDPGINCLRWRCRRGMRELDTLLMACVDRWYGTAPAAEQAAFRTLLSLSDPEILDLLTGRLQSNDEHITRVVEHVLGERIS